MIDPEIADIAFEFSDGQPLSFSREVVKKGLEDEVVIDFLNDREVSFKEEDLPEIKKLIIEGAESHISALTYERQKDFTNELYALVQYYKNEQELDDLSITKILIDTANSIFPNI